MWWAKKWDVVVKMMGEPGWVKCGGKCVEKWNGNVRWVRSVNRCGVNWCDVSKWYGVHWAIWEWKDEMSGQNMNGNEMCERVKRGVHTGHGTCGHRKTLTDYKFHHFHHYILFFRSSLCTVPVLNPFTPKVNILTHSFGGHFSNCRLDILWRYIILLYLFIAWPDPSPFWVVEMSVD